MAAENQEIEIPESIKRILDEVFVPYYGRALENLDRVASLIKIGLRTPEQKALIKVLGSAEGEKEVVGYDDVLRSAVVLMHAALEDVLRTMARGTLLLASPEVLEKTKISLKGLGRGEKFSLWQLAEYRGKTVDDLIHDSVEADLRQTSYNSTGDIAKLLGLLGIDPAPYELYFSTLEAMIQRRHQIVHWADRPQSSQQGVPPIAPIDPVQVHDWVRAANAFLMKLIQAVGSKQVGDKLRARGLLVG